MSMKAPPRSVWSRSTRLVSLAAGLARREVESRVQQAVARTEALQTQLLKLKSQVDQAKAIVEALGQLKGAAMKAGQLLSMELKDVLPPEVVQVLAQLQDAGTQVDFEEIRSILEDELGREKMAQLEVEERPLASASIGQVHRARWSRPEGGVEDVVLKVQFRGIAETIDSDLELLERISRVFLAVQLKNMNLEAVFAELKAVLTLETDYLHEARALERYRERALTVPGLAVPRVFHELSSKRVLALSYEHGMKLQQFLDTAPSAAQRNAVAHQLLDLYFHEFFDWGLVQTDANFANFLIRPASGELVLLDFGATRSYARPFRDRYRRLLLHTFRRERREAFEVACELGLIDPREGPVARGALHELLEAVLRVFEPGEQPVDFTSKRFVDPAARKLKAYYQALEFSAPPAQLLFLHRKLGGTYTMGRALFAHLDLVPYWRRLEGMESLPVGADEAA